MLEPLEMFGWLTPDDVHKLADEGRQFHAIVTDRPYDLTTARKIE